MDLDKRNDEIIKSYYDIERSVQEETKVRPVKVKFSGNLLFFITAV